MNLAGSGGTRNALTTAPTDPWTAGEKLTGEAAWKCSHPPPRGFNQQETICLKPPSHNINIVAFVGESADVTELERVKFVMKGGVVVKNDIAVH